MRVSVDALHTGSKELAQLENAADMEYYSSSRK
jgi:hypothetical protein